MGIENTYFGKIQNHIYEHYLPYWNGFNALIFVIVGILFSLNRLIFWDKIHSNTLGWIIFGIIILSSVWHISKQINDSKTIERLEVSKNEEIIKLKEDKTGLVIKIQEVENKLAKINNNSIEIVEIHLAYLAERMKLSSNERITLYKYINDEFYVLGRFSSNPELKKRSRVSYKKEGLIFKAWLETKYFKNTGIPEPNQKNGKINNSYIKILNNISEIDPKVLLNMKMKSRSFYIKAFKDLMNLEQTSIIVIESILGEAFEEAFIDSILNNEEEKRLVAFVEKIDWDFPNISNAREKGF